MSDTRKLFKALLKKEFYKEHVDRLPLHSFDEFGRDLLGTLKISYEKLDRDLTEDDVLQMHVALNPVITTANKNSVEAYLERVKNEPNINSDTAKFVFAGAWRSEVGRRIAEYGIRLGQGEENDLEWLHNYLATVSPTFAPKEDLAVPVPLDPGVLFPLLSAQGKWNLNIPQLITRVKRLSGGTLIIILARPESGKTACIVNLVAGKEGFAAQGAKTVVLCNEEGAEATAGRAICCYTETSFDDLRQNPKIADTEAWHKTRQNLIFLHRPEITFTQLEAFCKKERPDVLVVDQLDHLTIKGDYEKGHERLGAIYRRARELASKYNCVLIGVSQASAEAEDRTKVSFSMAEGSKTAKAAAADLIIGIGKGAEEADGEGNICLRHFTVSKNKISGWRGTTICKLVANQSRLVA